MRRAVTLVVLLFPVLMAFGQKPEITSVSKTMGAMDDLLVIKGAYFGTNASNVAVTFGASKGVIQSITDQQLTVKVPFGTLYQRIGVTNLVTGLTGYSKEMFLLNFSGDGAFDPANLQGQYDFPAGVATADGLYDLCTCDFDGDKRVDVAGANNNLGFLTIVSNASSPGSLSFPNKYLINIASRSLNLRCGDLNGDGKPDIVATESTTSNKVFILRNTSTGAGNFTFSTSIVTLAGKRPRRVEIADLDLDGKPEVILSSQTTNTVTVLINQSTTGAILFAPLAPITVPLTGAASTDALSVADLNGDGMPEIITSQFSVNSDIYVIENTSSPGSVSTGSVRSLPVARSVKNIRAGDLNGDGKPDIAYTKVDNQEVGFFINQSTAANIAFSPGPSIASDLTPWGIDFGDLDGDGKPEVVVASATRKSLTILHNTTASGVLSFTASVKPTTYINRHVSITDFDGDGKPDIGFTSIDDGALNIPASKISIFRNRACMIPNVTPEGPLNVCAGYGLTLTATMGGGVTYTWTNTSTGTSVSGTNTYSPTVSGEYYVTADAEGGNCSVVSNAVKVTISPGTAGDPAPVNNGPVCVGNTLNLSATDIGPGFTYTWRGPNGYAGTGLTPAPVTNFQSANAGIYYLDVVASSGCVARTEETLVTAVHIPEFKVAFTGSPLICQPDVKNLSVYPTTPGFTYQWYEQTGGAITGATLPNLLRNTSGEYYFRATSSNPGCPVIESLHAVLTVVTPPTADFTAPATACKGEEVSFTDQSTFDAQSSLSYNWAFGDGDASTDKNPKHIFATSSSFTITLTVSYPGNACPAVTTRSIVITEAPTALITTTAPSFEICPDASITLGVSNTFGSYVWSTGQTSPTITVNAAGTYSVDVIATNGCRLKAIQEITELPVPDVSATATPDIINEGESVKLSAAGLLNFAWTPAALVSEPAAAETMASPTQTTTFTVSGSDANGCVASGTVDVRVRGDAIVNKLAPGNFFSPNGDATGQYWVVGGIEDYPQCGILIFDDKGVKVYETKPYLNNWEGTFTSGRPLPDGVYYYIIRCDGEENRPKSGSITLIR